MSVDVDSGIQTHNVEWDVVVGRCGGVNVVRKSVELLLMQSEGMGRGTG